MFDGARFYVDRVCRGDTTESPSPDFVLKAGDRIAVAARHEPLIAHAGAFGVEIAEGSLVPGAADRIRNGDPARRCPDAGRTAGAN
jgi:hypothetical protein